MRGEGTKMWMLLGLAGLLVASSMADVFLPADASDDADPSDGGLDDGLDHDEASMHDGDLLSHDDEPSDVDTKAPDDAPDDVADTETSDTDARDDASAQTEGADAAPGPAPDPIPEMPDPIPEMDDRLPIHDIPDDSDGLSQDDWFGNEFVSSDIPVQTPTGNNVALGDDGGRASGGAGNDALIGGAGDDWLDGQGGDDGMDGDAGNDTLMGGAGQDTLLGGEGNDSLVSGSGDGLLVGGSGDDCRACVFRAADSDGAGGDRGMGGAGEQSAGADARSFRGPGRITGVYLGRALHQYRAKRRLESQHGHRGFGEKRVRRAHGRDG